MKTWFNAEAYHGIAAGVYYADQLVLKDVLGNDYSILTSNHPLPPNSTEAIQKNVNFFIQGKKMFIRNLNLRRFLRKRHFVQFDHWCYDYVWFILGFTSSRKIDWSSNTSKMLWCAIVANVAG